MSTRATARWPVIVPLNDVRGAVSGAAIAVPARARPTVWATPLTDGTSAFGIVNGLVKVVTIPRPNSS